MLNDCTNSNDCQLLWQQVREGDTQAFAKMIKLFYQDLYNYGHRFSKDTETIKENIQNLWVDLWKNRENLNDTPSLKNYLLKALRRRILKSMHRSRQTTEYSEQYFDADFNMVLPVENNIILQERLTELSYKVRTVLEKLSKRQQEIIYLRFYHEMEVDEISDIMELNRQSVYNLLHDAFKRFKNLSSPEYFFLSFDAIILIVSLLFSQAL